MMIEIFNFGSNLLPDWAVVLKAKVVTVGIFGVVFVL